MQRMIQTQSVTTEFYPKVHALNDGTFVLIGSGSVTVQKFLMEPTKAVTENETVFLAEGYWGSYYIIVGSGGEITVASFASSYGSQYDGTYWIDGEIPAPTEEDAFGTFGYAGDEYVVDIGYTVQPYEYDGNLFFPEGGVLIDLDGYVPSDSDVTFFDVPSLSPGDGYSYYWGYKDSGIGVG